MCLSVLIITKDIQSRMDERSSRIWKLHYLVVRLTKLPAGLEPSATSMCIIYIFGIWLCFFLHWPLMLYFQILSYWRLCGVFVCPHIPIQAWLIILHLVGCCCFSSVNDQKVSAIECLKKCCSLLLRSYPYSSRIVCSYCFCSIPGDCWYKTKGVCSESPKNQH